MPTTQGRVLAGIGVAFLVLGRLLGVPELYVLGAGAIGLVLIAVAFVLQSRVSLDLVRDLRPPRLHAGSPCRVELRVSNTGGQRTPVLTLQDPVGERRSAVVVLNPLDVGEVVEASYRLPTERRGVLPIGPLTVQVSDPFGVASASIEAAPVAELTVWPAIDDVAPLPHTTGDDPHGGDHQQHALSHRGEEFYALRPYVVGDDLRRVHWRSTARRDELIVRQNQQPWQARSTVLLDTRRGAHDEESFERAVSGAASVVMACGQSGHQVRFVTTDGLDSGEGSGHAHLEAILERLAAVELAAGGTAANSAPVWRAGSGGALAAMVGARVRLEGLGRLHTTFARVVVVPFGANDEPFVVRWAQALRTASMAARQ
jgi:uncharacterized protein (DUF58 family)